VWCFFAFLGRLKRYFTRLLLARYWQEERGKQSLQLGGLQLRPPPLQTGINTKILKISPEWRWLLIDEIFLYLFAKFELHPSNVFQEN